MLQGTGVPEAVEKDLANIRSESYSIVLPFMDAHADLFSPRVRSLELYRQLVALVMAYRSVSRALQRTLFFRTLLSDQKGKDSEPHPNTGL